MENDTNVTGEVTEKQETEQKTFTQDELNAIVSDRVKRANEKYADYEDLKKKATRFDEIQEANKSELEKAQEKATALETELNALKASNALREVKEAVAKETGVPIHLLTADNEDALREQAKAIAEYAKPVGYPTVKDSGEVSHVGKHSTREQFAEWAAQAFN